MIKILCRPVVFLLAGVFLFLMTFSGEAQQPGAEGLAVALIIDSSGSMKDNDPNQVRIEAAQKVVSLLNGNDQVTVVEFAGQASVLIPLSKAGDTASRSEINSKLSAIDTKGDTDIKGGLESAFAQLSQAEEGKKKVAILLSDGEPDLPVLLQDNQKMAAYLADLEQLAAEYQTHGWTINCLALQEQEAGQTLQKIARISGGEYFIVKEAAELTSFFQSILLAQKYAEEEKPGLSYIFENRTYKVGERINVSASLKVGDDLLIPGPYLQLDKLVLAVHYDGQGPLLIDMLDDGKELAGDKQAGDGIFSALVNCEQSGEVTFYITAQGSYRNQAINEQVELGKVMIKPEFSSAEVFVMGLKEVVLQNQKILAAALAAIIVLLFLIMIMIRKNKKGKEKIKGSLQYWAEETGDVLNPKVLNIAGSGKSEIVITSENKAGVDFVLPALKRPFSFKIKKFTGKNANADDIKEFNLTESDFYYWVICLPGTYLVSNGIPKSRQQIFHEDLFSIGGYTFKFVCKEAQSNN